jgi:hypothetical protein
MDAGEDHDRRGDAVKGLTIVLCDRCAGPYKLTAEVMPLGDQKRRCERCGDGVRVQNRLVSTIWCFKRSDVQSIDNARRQR